MRILIDFFKKFLNLAQDISRKENNQQMFSKDILIIISSRGIFMRSIITLLCFSFFIVVQAGRYNVSLTKWNFHIENDTRQYSATIPSSLSLDLVDNGIITDPYFRDNFLQYYNYETKDVSYRTQFNISSDLLSSNHQFIIFEGLDTHAEVYLNGQHILSAHNMFRRFEVEVKLKAINTLIVNFTSSVKYDLQKQSEFKNEYQFSLPQNYSFTRKAAYQYGWDWGPRILTVGIWKDVNILIYNDSKIEDLKFTHGKITKNTSQTIGTIQASLKDLDPKSSYNLSISVHTKSHHYQFYRTSIKIDQTTSKQINVNFTILINSSILWYTWDLGNPNLIGIQLELINLNTSGSTTSQITTGIRTIEVIQETSGFNGTSFKFRLNGYDIYMRGGNYIPPEMSIARTTHQKNYLKVAVDARFAKFNMIRLWGGGQFQKDQFYAAMDEFGILIWHDLMFACALYPSSDDILENIQAEMRDNVKRIRNHPSIALWNGNNEVWIGWLEWGWQSGLTTAQKQLVQKMYSDIFKKILPKVIEEEHPSVYYWQTSPSVSSGSPKANFTSGDIHFWRVWGGGTKIEEYEFYIGRFNSQYGIQSMPEMSSIQKFTSPEDRTINSYILRLHERHIKGDQYLPGYTFNYSGQTSDLARFSYYSQVMQAYALELAIVSLRLNKPFNMGSLYWQLNDVWPVSSWATVDYYGTYKAAHYRIRQVYSQLMIHTLHDLKSGDYIVYIVNENNQTYYCHCTIEIQLYTGQILQNYTYERTVPPFQRVFVRRFPKEDYEKLAQVGYFKTHLTTTTGLNNSNTYFMVPMKERLAKTPNLQFTVSGTIVTIKTDTLASYIWIYRKKQNNYLPLTISDNYFTLRAKQEKIVNILGQVPENQIFVTCYEIQRQKDRGFILTKQQ